MKSSSVNDSVTDDKGDIGHPWHARKKADAQFGASSFVTLADRRGNGP